MDTYTWLITGASSGLGASLALEALKAGHRVLGTTRDVAKAQASLPNFANAGGIWLCIDPGARDAHAQFSRCAQEYSIDVLVNNAGYAFIGGVEDLSEQEMRDQMEVNFYGPLRSVQAVLPSMRTKKFGNIVLMSSGAGFTARPARAAYSASKFAIEAVHESLSQELRSFGIKVLIVEPGAFRTPFSARIITPSHYQSTGGYSDAYRGTAVEQMVGATRSMSSLPDFVKGDPVKAARVIVRAVDGGHDYLRLPLGPDCVKALEEKIGSLQKDLSNTMAVALSTDVD